jgi:hypothetical protein
MTEKYNGVYLIEVADNKYSLLLNVMLYRYNETNVMHFLFNLAAPILVQSTDITRTQCTKCCLLSAS